MKKQGGYIVVFILALIGAGFFYGQKTRASQNILISEIQIYPTESRFIELYNPNSLPVDLTNWYLQRKTQSGASFSSLISKTYFSGKIIGANSYFLISRSSLDGSDIVLSGLTLSEANIIQLKDANGDVVNKVGWGDANDCQGACALTPAESQSLGRKLENSIFIDTGDNANDFAINSCPSPKAQSAVCQTTGDNQPGDGNNPATSTPPAIIDNETAATSTASTSPQFSKVNFGDVLINELVSDPADNENEWIEIYNKTYREIDLTGWWIEEGGKAKTILSGKLGASGAGRYKIIDKPVGSLNNGGDIVILYDASGRIIDQVAYGGWDDGDIGNNAAAASDPLSLARKFDGYNTYNNLNDFAITSTPTKGAGNIIKIEDEVSSEAKAKFDFSSDIFISEILPNPDGDDAKLEFMEIYNAGKREVNLTGWSLSNEDNKKVNLEKIATSTIIRAGEYLVFFRPRSKIVLHNDQGQIKLFQPLADKPFIIVDYKNTKEGWSYNLADFKIKDEWVWSETITPGAMNVFKAINHLPEVEFSFSKEVLAGRPVIFDSSDANDQDGDKLKFSWDFGDGFKNDLANPEHTYLKVGVYKISLEVSDGQGTTTKEKSIKVFDSFEGISDVSEIDLNVEIPINSPLPRGAVINEIFPNPAGADTGEEWLELKNQSAEQINLLNWRVENSNGKYKFNNVELLDAGIFYVLDNSVSRLAFKNTDDTIRLYNDLDELVDQVEYAGAVQGEAYARGANGNWFWTTRLTPAEENIISLAGSKSEIITKVSAAAGADGYIETTLEKVKELDIGSLVKVKGTVAVEPGILGVQIFYIVGSPGMQIYNYKKDFPVLRVGDYIEVTGELAQTQGEFRIKTKDKNDIKIAGSKQTPQALAVKSDEVSEENIGQLITITGEITDKKSSSLYVDDGSDETFVYIKQNTGISAKSLVAGQKVAVTGILSKTQTGLRLLPRYQEDIVLINSADGLEPQVLGETVEAEEWNLAERDKKLELFKYLLIIAGGVIIALGILFIKSKRKS
ncbi:MAG: lamin tail domain-containing protein [Patescibacteria group bacterium]|jgi:PKD repeat protein